MCVFGRTWCIWCHVLAILSLFVFVNHRLSGCLSVSCVFSVCLCVYERLLLTARQLVVDMSTWCPAGHTGELDLLPTNHGTNKDTFTHWIPALRDYLIKSYSDKWEGCIRSITCKHCANATVEIICGEDGVWGEKKTTKIYSSYSLWKYSLLFCFSLFYGWTKKRSNTPWSCTSSWSCQSLSFNSWIQDLCPPFQTHTSQIKSVFIHKKDSLSFCLSLCPALYRTCF